MNKTIASIAALSGTFALGMLAVSYGNARDSIAQDSHADHHHEAPIVDTQFTDEQEQDIRDVVRAYLLDNPEVLVEAVRVYESRQQLAAAQKAQDGAQANLASLLDEKNGFVTDLDDGNAKVAVIELFDYHCGYCKNASSLVRDLAQADPNVVVAFREFPILRKESEVAAEAALAARKQGKYLDFHFSLMNAKGVLTKERILDIASKTKLDVKKLEADMQSDEITTAIRDTNRIAEDMGVTGTPAFIVASLENDYVDVIQGFSPEAILRSVEAAKQ